MDYLDILTDAKRQKLSDIKIILKGLDEANDTILENDLFNLLKEVKDLEYLNKEILDNRKVFCPDDIPF